MWRCHSAAADSSRSPRCDWVGMACCAVVDERTPLPVPEFAGRQFPGPRRETLCLIETFVLNLVRTAMDEATSSGGPSVSIGVALKKLVCCQYSTKVTCGLIKIDQHARTD